MASTPRDGVADLNLEDDDSIKKMSEVAKFARQNNIPGYRPNGHRPRPQPQKQRSENSIRETPMSALRRRLSGWFGLASPKPPRRANSLPGKISRDDSDCFSSERACSLSSREILPGRLFARRGGFGEARPSQPERRLLKADMGVSRIEFSERCFCGFGRGWWPFGR